MHSLTALLAITGIGGDPNEEISGTGRQGRERKSCICIDKCPASLICEMGMKI